MPNPGMRATVPPVATEPAPHGLLSSCVPVVPATDLHELNGTQTLTANCLTTNLWQDCPSGTWTNPPEKVFFRPEPVSFEPITVYSGIECSTFGLSQDEAEAMALESLRQGESKSLEWFVMQKYLCPFSVDVTNPGGTRVAMTIVDAFSLLEGWYGTFYGSPGVIHLPVALASYLAAEGLAFPTADGCLKTLSGFDIVIGPGYGRGEGTDNDENLCRPPDDGQFYAYVTPPMRIRRDERHLVPSGQTGSINRVTNDRRTLAETTFVVEMACPFIGRVRVQTDQPVLGPL